MDQIEAVIFDMDGLLLDSQPVWDEAGTILLQRRGHVYTEEVRERVLGLGQKESIAVMKDVYHIAEDTDVLVQERYVICFALLEKKLHLMPGAKALVERMAQRYSLAIATGGYPVPKIQEILEKTHLREYFAVLTSSEEVVHGKPSPEVYILAAQRLGKNPSVCMVVEDAPNGVIAGKAAGMCVIGVNRDKHMQQLLVTAGADKVFATLAEVAI